MNYNYKNTIWFWFWIIVSIILLLLTNKWLRDNATTTVREGFESDYEDSGLDKKGLNPEFTSIDTLEASFKPVPGFVPWSKDLLQRFKIYQTTVSTNVKQYNMYVLQQQATADEAEYLIKTGYWPWPDDLKDEYIKAVWQNPIIKIDAGSALKNAQEMYCKTAARQLLGWNTKEGQFLITGVDAGRTNSMPVKNTIKCSADLNNSVLQKTVYKSYNLFNGYKNSETTTIKNEDIPAEVPGFSFVNGPCNPCNAINQNPQYNCPFNLATKDKSGISPVWKSLWGL